MPEIKRLTDDSADFGHFRVPKFTVTVKGAGLPGDVLRDVIQVSYKDSLKEIDSFEILVNNWDAASRVFTYVGSETASFLASSPDGARYKLFEPSNSTFEISMGYQNKLSLMVKGKCTTMEPSFPNSGASTLSGRGLNVLHELRTKQYTDTYANKRASEIAREISNKSDPDTNRKRFPMSIDIDNASLAKEKQIVYLSQKNQYDIDFLLGLARRQGYVVYVREDAKKKSRLYFGPSNGDAPKPLRDVTYVLKWGASLMDFKPVFNAANQIRSVTVRGHNRNTKKRIKEKVTLDDPAITINRDLLPILKACEPREEVVVDVPVATEALARERALAILLERYKELVVASGTSIGLPDLRAGMQVKIEGVGSRFSGTYFITESTHTINESGYLTKFTARREDTEAA
jgi:phage protein D